MQVHNSGVIYPQENIECKQDLSIPIVCNSFVFKYTSQVTVRTFSVPLDLINKQSE